MVSASNNRASLHTNDNNQVARSAVLRWMLTLPPVDEDLLLDSLRSVDVCTGRRESITRHDSPFRSQIKKSGLIHS
jgi:hypothetical protein